MPESIFENPYTPRYRLLTFRIPKIATISRSGPTWVDKVSSNGMSKGTLENPRNGDPIGVAVNGVPIFNVHSEYHHGAVKTTGITRK